MRNLFFLVSSVCCFSAFCEDVSLANQLDNGAEWTFDPDGELKKINAPGKQSVAIKPKLKDLANAANQQSEKISQNSNYSINLKKGNFSDVVSQIKINGLNRVEKGAIADAITIQPNKKFTNLDIDESLHALYKKDFFSDIKFFKKGDTLIIEVTERPMVDKIAFENNSEANDDMLKGIINGRLGEGRLFSKKILKDVVSDIQLAYQTIGYCSATINPQLIKRPGNVVDVVFDISEGAKTTVKKIEFIGNKSFSDDELKDVMSTKEERRWRFWDSESHVFRPDRVDVDTEAITIFYRNNGHPEFKITGSQMELSQDRKSYYCTFLLEEGQEFHIGNVELKSDVDNVEAKDYEHFIKVKSKDLYDEALISESKDAILKSISLNDHPFVDVLIETDLDHKTGLANLKFSIVKTKKAFIERIDIVGNTRTLDRVIRRVFSVHEGDPLNVYKVQNSIDKLKALEFFDDVNVEETPGSTDDKKVLVVSLKEKDSTAQIKAGLNVSDADGFGGFVGFSEANIFGTGRAFNVDAFWMQKYYGCNLDLFDPYFLDNNLGLGIRLGAHSLNRKNKDDSVTKSGYISPYIRYKIAENLYHRVSYTISTNEKRWCDHEGKLHTRVPDNISQDDLPLMKDEFGRYTCGELASTLIYDQTDSAYEPRNGYSVSLTNAYAGLIGNCRYLNNKLEVIYYKALSKKFTFIMNSQVGILHEIRNTRSGDRYALGGDGYSMRGFNSLGIGPKDLRGNSLGGNRYWSVSLMTKAPLSTREMGINGIAFIDFGSAWGSKYKKEEIRDSKAMRISAGVAIEWAHSPLGVPLSFIFGFPIKKKKFDEKQTFTLTGIM